MLASHELFDLLDGLRGLLYEQPGCCVGGPLHVQLDDGNMEDRFMSLENYPYLADFDPAVIALCECILIVLRRLNVEEREFWWGGRLPSIKCVRCGMPIADGHRYIMTGSGPACSGCCVEVRG